eukprot:scaffold263678_cov44-Prasinocladus_malaysianus.AAC.1
MAAALCHSTRAPRHNHSHSTSISWRGNHLIPLCHRLKLTLCLLVFTAIFINGCKYRIVREGEFRAAVCVVGQVGRLETDSKVKNLLTPNKAAHGSLDVILVLEEGEAAYTNAKTKPCGAAPESLEV